MQQTIKKLSKSVKISNDSIEQIKSYKNSLESSIKSSRKSKSERKSNSARRRLNYKNKQSSLALPDLKVEAEAIQEVLFDQDLPHID